MLFLKVLRKSCEKIQAHRKDYKPLCLRNKDRCCCNTRHMAGNVRLSRTKKTIRSVKKAVVHSKSDAFSEKLLIANERKKT